MKITGVTTFLAHPGVGKNLCFVKIDTDEGIYGWVAGLERTTGMVERAPMLVEPHSHEAGRLLSGNGLLVNLETGDHDWAKDFFDRALVTA